MFDDRVKTPFYKKVWYSVKVWLIYNYKLKRKFASVGGEPVFWGIENLVIHGPNIKIGKNLVFTSTDGACTNLTTIRTGGFEGRITVGNNVLIMNGVRISSANEIIIGDDCMLANYCYITDADWHDIYDRTTYPGRNAPVILERGVWIGDSAIICKGVTIGENSIVGAGSVVRRDVPANSVVAGNPAKVIKKLDPSKIITMSMLQSKIKTAGDMHN